MTTVELFGGVAVALMGGGLVKAIAELRKGKPESAAIVVNAASVAVEIQDGVIERQEKEMEKQRQALAALEAKFGDMERRLTDQIRNAETARLAAEEALRLCHDERHQAAVLLQREQEQNRSLTERVAALEAEVAELRRASTPPSRREKGPK